MRPCLGQQKTGLEIKFDKELEEKIAIALVDGFFEAVDEYKFSAT